MDKYTVWYNGWGINVDANSIKQARHKAYVKFNEEYPTQYGTFMRGIEEVAKVSGKARESVGELQ